MRPRRLRGQQPLGVGGHVAGGQIAVRGLDQHAAIGIDQDRTKGMIAVRMRLPCHGKSPAQEAVMVERTQRGVQWIGHGERSLLVCRISIRLLLDEL